jgi:hypothetical protein
MSVTHNADGDSGTDTELTDAERLAAILADDDRRDLLLARIPQQSIGLTAAEWADRIGVDDVDELLITALEWELRSDGRTLCGLQYVAEHERLTDAAFIDQAAAFVAATATSIDHGVDLWAERDQSRDYRDRALGMIADAHEGYLCELCTLPQSARYRLPDDTCVCATHADALESGEWDGEEHAIGPITTEGGR